MSSTSKPWGEIIKDEVIEHIDHKNMNLDVPFLKGIMASTENVAIAVWDRLVAPIQKEGGDLVKSSWWKLKTITLNIMEERNRFRTFRKA